MLPENKNPLKEMGESHSENEVPFLWQNNWQIGLFQTENVFSATEKEETKI